MKGAALAKRTVHIVEPTLEDYAGHCYALVHSFCDAAEGVLHVKLWAGKNAANLGFPQRIEVRPYFSRHLRLLQLLMLFRRLLRSADEPVVVMTARRFDLTLARLATGGKLEPGRLFLYFHWFRQTPRRMAYLRRAAATNPQVTILTTTESATAIFKSAGFERVTWLPYPITAAQAKSSESGFRHLLYAGAARADKGFGAVVDLVELLQRRGMRVPITVQASAEHYGKYDEATRANLARLERSGYASLRLVRETLDPAQYADLFRGAICLQPYDRNDYRDRVSGVTLDALTYGAPVIGPAGTWIERQFAEDSAGVALEDMGAESMLGAAQAVMASYERYRNNALAAGKRLVARSWAPLLSLMGQKIHGSRNGKAS
jgi:hypothetical protein